MTLLKVILYNDNYLIPIITKLTSVNENAKRTQMNPTILFSKEIKYLQESNKMTLENNVKRKIIRKFLRKLWKYERKSGDLKLHYWSPGPGGKVPNTNTSRLVFSYS